MAETTIIGRTRSDASVAGAAETLRAQQQLLQKLYAELDNERESSATAAREAMDMILRLQGEKAAVEMEASQFKRMAEGKMGHAEAIIEAFEELLYDKEMETASLKFQLQAYKDKLVSFGCVLNASEFQNANSNSSDESSGTVMRRLQSLPPIPFKKIMTLRESVTQKMERSPSLAPVSGDKEPSLVFGSGTIDSYWNKIKMLHEQVKVISDCYNNKGTNLRSRGGRSSSTFSQATSKITCECDQEHRLDTTKYNEVASHGESVCDNTALADHRCWTKVLDVFEVPQAIKKHEVSDNEGRKRLEKWNTVTDNRLTKSESVSEEVVESPFKFIADKKKGTVSFVGQQKERMGVDCNSQAEVRQRIARFQRQKISRRTHETTHGVELGDGDEQLRLLKDIQINLKLIQTEMKSWKTKNATPVDNAVSFDILKEAMLHFWI
ncbi:uncharacterized protein [Cicer arietinum]|uniref:Uncharacterized protein LOC101499309 n=1 Tax=Cicer arietinum TaxID=3827 RepID=A0A1S3DVH0_CICAR|nr:uncharacterized protein LOC101499309 [Cicer arietinum]XP_012567221.1 uncharacterized protein LOC101499309 [Cicer arietinum]XP_027190349.1 uncharacterized protein LOC101499309 [Cicer arietinum]XP_027190351.1 uncharacterized protein LOC101499309 [Cicer arietinum]